MGCFRACFGDSKRRKQPRKRIPHSNHGLKAFNAKEVVEVPWIDPDKDSREKLEEQIELCHATEKACKPIVEDDKVIPTKGIENNLDEIAKEDKIGSEQDEPREGPNLSNAFSLPPNHRYADCSNSDEDDLLAEMDYLDDDTNGGGKSMLLIEQETSGSLFSLSLGSRTHVCTVEAGENEVNSFDLSHLPGKASSDKKPRCRNENVVDSVLNPIENVTHCSSAAKVKTLPPVHHLEKENISQESTFPSMREFKENRSELKHVEGDIAVDTSLSNWLVESETMPKSKSSTSSSIGNSPMSTRNSAKSYEDRPILGALTLEELRQFSAFSTPKRSRSRSPEETPIIGTVGSYWHHTGHDAGSNPDSSLRGSTKTRKNEEVEDVKVNWNSTPFLERLNMALATNSAEV